jgi:PIN domain nuclease of toxin-antitoxin system
VRLLLDTHALLWAALDDVRLSAAARAVLLKTENDLYLSAASAWEIMIKYQAGKLRLPQTPDRFLRSCLSLLALEPLSVTFDHAVKVETLPDFHRDPFDRILVAQAQSENLILLTKDDVFRHYPVQTLW